MSANDGTEGWGHSGAAAAGGGVVRRGGGAAAEFIYLFIYAERWSGKTHKMYSPHTSRRDLREESYKGKIEIYPSCQRISPETLGIYPENCLSRN